MDNVNARDRLHLGHTLRIVAAATVLIAVTGDDPRAAAGDPGTAARNPAASAVIRVGPGRELARPSAAAKIARDGDVIEIEAGNYDGDAASWTQNGLTIRGVGGRAHLRAAGANAEGKAIWVIKGANTTIENVEFSGATVGDGNGAGIRQEGAGLIVRSSYFHHNQNGILTSPNKTSDIVIEHSEFAHNGTGDGSTHNIYIGEAKSFTLRYSYVHHAVVGHDVKSRALTNHIAYNRIMDEKDGRSSYSIDLSNGGLAFVIGNVIQQGPEAENSGIISYGAEGYKYPVNELYVVSNTIVNNRPNGAQFVTVRPGAQSAKILNNVFSGRGETLRGTADLRDNIELTRSDFVNADAFDYHLKAKSPAIGRGIDPGSAHGFSLRPTEEYVDKARKRNRSSSGKLDLGAFEFRP
jgi:hypothetical protein